MPLRDHFRPPLTDRISWEGLHGLWPGMIVLRSTVTCRSASWPSHRFTTGRQSKSMGQPMSQMMKTLHQSVPA